VTVGSIALANLFVETLPDAAEKVFVLADLKGDGLEIIALRGAFHGRLFGTLAATDRPSYRVPFRPLAGGITIVERKTPDAGAYASQLTVSSDGRSGPVKVSGTVAGGEPRITGLGEYRLDMEPADVMLITRHTDKPGMVGRIGAMLGEADVNISAMHLARTRPREDALMILALDDDVPPSVEDAIRAQDAVLELWAIRLGRDR